jgi:hypothetical protein
MIEVSRSLPVNDGTLPELSLDAMWEGLLEKARNPLPYVKAITECTIVEELEGGLVRDVSLHGQSAREVVTFYPKELVHFVRTSGMPGTIDNKLAVDDNGDLQLTFSFRLVVPGAEAGSDWEREVADAMVDDYLDAVRTTIAAARDRVAAAV